MVKPHSCTHVLSLSHQFSMLGAGRGLHPSFRVRCRPHSIDRGGDLMSDERLKSHTSLSDVCVLCIQLPPGAQCHFQLGWQLCPALPSAAPRARVCPAGPELRAGGRIGRRLHGIVAGPVRAKPLHLLLVLEIIYSLSTSFFHDS